MRNALITLYRSLFPCLLLGVFLYMLSGYYVLYDIKRNAIRKEVGEKLKAHSITLTVLTVPDRLASGVTREGPHEIIVGGDLYDVVKEVHSKGATTYYCFHDRQEEFLVAGLQKATDQQLPAAIAQLLDLTALPPDSPAMDPRPCNLLTFPTCFVPLTSHLPLPQSPPPKSAFIS